MFLKYPKNTATSTIHRAYEHRRAVRWTALRYPEQEPSQRPQKAATAAIAPADLPLSEPPLPRYRAAPCRVGGGEKVRSYACGVQKVVSPTTCVKDTHAATTAITQKKGGSVARRLCSKSVLKQMRSAPEHVQLHIVHIFLAAPSPLVSLGRVPHLSLSRACVWVDSPP